MLSSLLRHTDSGQRVWLIDLVRVLLSIGVLFGHYQFLTNAGGQPINFVGGSQPFYEYLRYFYDFGGTYRVQTFWAISGFVLFYRYGTSIANGQLRGYDFFRERFARLYPLHFVTLCAIALINHFYIEFNDVYFRHQNNDAWHFFLNIFFASAWGLESGKSFNGPVWAVSVEIFVLIIFFLNLRSVGTSSKKTLIVLSMCALLRSLNFGLPQNIIDCAIFFYAGVLAAGYCKTDNAPRVAIGYAALLVLVTIILVILGFSLESAHTRTNFWVVLTYTHCGVLVLANCRLSIPHSLERAIVKLGRLTFPIYMLHFPLIFFIAFCYSLYGLPVPYKSPGFLAGFVFLVIFVSYLAHRYYEVPMRNWILFRLVPASRLLKYPERSHKTR